MTAPADPGSELRAALEAEFRVLRNHDGTPTLNGAQVHVVSRVIEARYIPRDDVHAEWQETNRLLAWDKVDELQVRLAEVERERDALKETVDAERRGRLWAQRLVGSLPGDVRASFDAQMERLDSAALGVSPGETEDEEPRS